MHTKSLAAAAALAAALVLSACGGSDAGTAPEPAPPATTEAAVPPATTEGAATESAATTAESEPVETAPATTAENPEVTVVRLVGGVLEGESATIEVEQGDTVRLRVESDREDSIHVHGYDVEKPVGPGAPAVFEFEADLEGIFEVEAHHSDVEVARIVVEP